MTGTFVETICAISTAPGIGGIAVIRVSGPNTFSNVDRICSQDILRQKAMSISYGWVRDEAEDVDEVLVGKFVAPRSFTGEDVIEISCHGSLYVQQRIIQLLIQAGCSMASNGEFTKRAFLNGKMDLSQAEAVADLIASESSASHKLALQQMKGGYSSELSTLREKLIEFAALMELELDFSEEDVEFADRDEFRKLINTILIRVRSLVESFSLGNVIKQGVPVAIIGPPNSGKSTLLNALLKEQRAIVSDIAGTTRDAIEDTVNIDGILFRFIDTAGMRSTEDEIESQGINLALKKAEEASIVIRFMDGQAELNADEKGKTANYFESIGWEDDERTLRVLNKVDLLPTASKTEDFDITMSALHGTGLDELKDRLIAHVRAGMDGQSDILVTNARHVEALDKVDAALSTVLTGMDQGLPSDLLAIDIRKALHYLGEVTGEVTTDDLLGTIFSRFCIGK